MRYCTTKVYEALLFSNLVPILLYLKQNVNNSVETYGTKVPVPPFLESEFCVLGCEFESRLDTANDMTNALLQQGKRWAMDRSAAPQPVIYLYYVKVDPGTASVTQPISLSSGRGHSSVLASCTGSRFRSSGRWS
ncbi:hypothetical protein J6590_103399 [Homalodisca vitripennis]|nr:hypothetical protein J6590_103399 [Homalodisca vitripennis]